MRISASRPAIYGFLKHIFTVVVWSVCDRASQQGSIFPIRRGYRKLGECVQFHNANGF